MKYQREMIWGFGNLVFGNKKINTLGYIEMKHQLHGIIIGLHGASNE